MSVFEIYDDYIGLETFRDKGEIKKIRTEILSMIDKQVPLSRELVERWNKAIIQSNMNNLINESEYGENNKKIFLALMRGKTQFYARLHPEDREFEAKVRELCTSLGLI